MDGFFKIDREHILELLRIVDKDVNWFNYSITEILHVSRFFLYFKSQIYYTSWLPLKYSFLKSQYEHVQVLETSEFAIFNN